MRKGSIKLHPELGLRIQEVARQCRRNRALRSWARFGLATLALTCFFTLILRFTPPDGNAGKYLLAAFSLCEVVAAWRWLLAPLRSPITTEQVALFIDEHHPELENRIVSAVEFSAGGHEDDSPWLIRQFLEETTPLVRQASFADVLDTTPVFTFGAAAAVLLALSAGTVVLFSDFWMPTIGIVPDDLARRSTLPFTVEPGDARVRRGDNQMIWVRSDKLSNKVFLRWRMGEGDWQTSEMERSPSENVYMYLFSDVQVDIEYDVRFGRKRSATFELTAWTPPEVTSIDVLYTFPEYLEREPREVPNSGNVSAIEGSQVDMSFWVNKKLAGAEMVLASGKRIRLEESSEALWTTSFELSRNDKYHIELIDLQQEASEYNPRYAIRVDRDRPPEIRIQFPRGDSNVTMLEEVPFEFKVTDDYGIKEFGLLYEIAGREPVRLALHESGETIDEAEGQHEIELETLDLEVGDFITWTVWAKDAKPGRGEFELLGDPFFLEIRPFRMEYEEVVSDGGGGGGGGGGQEDEDTLVQKQIIIATWKLRSEAPFIEPGVFNERRGIIVETQETLQNKLSSGGGMMGNPSPESIRLGNAMSEAVKILKRTEMPEPETALSEALLKENEAYRLMLKMQPDRSQVRQQQGGGGGGGGGQRPDISALEMSRNRNFYEEENRVEQEQQQQAADEFLKKISELAQRQDLINEEIARLISELQNAKTEEEKEEVRRKLERLEEDLQDNLDRLDEVRQDLASEGLSAEQTRQAREGLEESREQMNRSLNELQNERFQQAQAAGNRATQPLDEIQDQLQQFGRDAAAERMKDIIDRMQELQDAQQGIIRQAEEFKEEHDSPAFDVGEDLDERKDELSARKEQLAEDFSEMMNEAGELAERGRQTQELMTNKLNDWLRETSRAGIFEDILEALPYIEYEVWDTAVEEEAKIGAKLDAAAERLHEVAQTIVESELQAMQLALEALDRVMPGQQGQGEPQGQGEEQGEGQGQGEEQGEGQGQGEEQGQGQGQGEEQGEGQGQGEEQGEGQGQGQGQQQGQGQGQGQGEEQGQGQGQGQGEQQGQSGGQGGGQGNQQQQAQRGQRNQRGGSTGGGGLTDRFGGNTGGAWWNGGPIPDLNMQDFIENDYRDWLEELRNAESLLPQDSDYRTQIARVREQIENMRRRFRADRNLVPKFDLFLDVVRDPLAETADQLQRDIQKLLDEQEFIMADEGEIPERFKTWVADYFTGLAESEGTR